MKKENIIISWNHIFSSPKDEKHEKKESAS